MLENFNEDKRKNSMTQFSDFHTGWSIYSIQYEMQLTYFYQVAFSLRPRQDSNLQPSEP